MIEMGVSLFGEMTRLTNMVHPIWRCLQHRRRARIWRRSGDRPGILRAKSEILQGMGPDAVIFASGDDALLSAAGRKGLLFGLENGSFGTASCCILAGTQLSVTVPAYGTYMIYSVLTAAAVSL